MKSNFAINLIHTCRYCGINLDLRTQKAVNATRGFCAFFLPPKEAGGMKKAEAADEPSAASAE
jgi:hypothetical protein